MVTRGLLCCALAFIALAHPQNFHYRFNQLQQQAVAAPAQRQYPTAVIPLVEGCLDSLSTGGFAFTASVTMVQDSGYNIIVDTPAATDTASKTKMLNALLQRSCSPGQIQMLVTTHGHPDHFGQGNFFPNARQFFDAFEYTGNTFIPNGLNENDTINLTPNVELWSTPGHTPQDTSVIVRNVPCCGTIAVVGDLFYSAADVTNSTMWELGAWSVAVGMPNRFRVICASDWIVPGHGPMFQVTDAMRAIAQCPATGTGTSVGPPVDNGGNTLPPLVPTLVTDGNNNLPTITNGNGITDFPFPTGTDNTQQPLDPNQTLMPVSGFPVEPDQPLPTDSYPPMPVVPVDQLPTLPTMPQGMQTPQINQLPMDQQTLQPPNGLPPFPTLSPNGGTPPPNYIQHQQPQHEPPPYQQPIQLLKPSSWFG